MSLKENIDVFLKKKEWDLEDHKKLNQKLLEEKTFYLQSGINNILIPYLIKIERKMSNIKEIKKLLKLEENKNKSVWIIIKENWHDIKITKKFVSIKKNNGIDNDNVYHLLDILRIARNKIMHENNFLFTIAKRRDLHNIKQISDYTHDEDRITLLATLFFIIKIFNSDPIYLNIFAKINYKIYLFYQENKHIIKKKEFYQALGLDVGWVKKII